MKQIKSVWDFGRFLLSFTMAGVGAFLLGRLITHSVGISAKTPLWIKISSYLPFILFGYFLGSIIFKTFLRLRPKCKSEWDFWMIMLSFSLAGWFISPVRKLIFHLSGITPQTPLWIKVPVYLILIPPTYYVGLMIFGTLLGQFTFFWGFISKRLKFLTGRKNSTS